MIGPGWLPSRPRPLGRVRRGLLSHTSRPRRRRVNQRSAAAASTARDGRPPGCDTVIMLFDGLPAELPTATLLPGASQSRPRVIGGHLRHWLDDRWAWLRPRTVPMIVAFIGMLAVLGSTKYLSTFAMSTPSRSFAIDQDSRSPRWIPAKAHAGHTFPSGRIRIVPVRPGSHDVTITLEP